MSKKLLSVILSILIVLSVFSAMPVLAEDNETEILGPGVGENTLPELSSDYNRYFFYMPDYWQFENRFELKVQYDNSGITYLEYADAEGVFFCDLPKETKAFYIVYGDEKVKAASPAPVVPDFSLQECCGKILVIDMDWLITDMSTGNNIYSGFWFYYYGNGEYGDVPVRGDGDIYTDSVINPILPPEKLFLCGDADQNGVINVKVATAIQKHIADIQPCDEVAGNVDFMSGLTIKDATAIQKYLAGIDTGFLIGQYVS